MNNQQITRTQMHSRTNHNSKRFYKKWPFWLISIIVVLVLILSIVLLTNSKKTADYTVNEAETALNDGKDIKNKTIKIKVGKVAPNSAFGYNILAGKHLNFVSDENPNVSKGDTIIVKVTNVKSTLGSYLITYKIK